jgi:hypothetical protein
MVSKTLLPTHPPQLPPLEGPIPVLRHLPLTLESPDELGSDDVVTLSEAPLLHSLTISYSTLSTPTVILPFAQLTSLTLHRAFRHEYVEILPQTPKLVHCDLVIEFDSATDPPPAGVELPRLEVLALSVFKTLGFRLLPTKCLDDFIVPALRRLRIPESLLQPAPVVDTLLSFVSKSNYKLRELCVGGRTSESEDFSTATHFDRRTFLLRNSIPSTLRAFWNCCLRQLTIVLQNYTFQLLFRPSFHGWTTYRDFVNLTHL